MTTRPPYPPIPDLARQLVLALIPSLADSPSSNDKRYLTNLTANAARQIRADSLGGARKEWDVVTRSVEGHAEAARIRVQDDLAEGLEKVLKDLGVCKAKGGKGWEEDAVIRMENLPQDIHLLLNLANRPTTQAHAYAYEYLHRQPSTGPTPDQILYQQIMEENPYDPGEVWDEEVRHGWTDSDSSLSDLEDQDESPEEEEVLTPSSRVVRAQKKRAEDERKREELEEMAERAREVVRGLEQGYWRGQERVGEMPEGLYGWKDMTTGTSTSAIAQKVLAIDGVRKRCRVIGASELQRELIFALSGRPGVMFLFDGNVCQIHDQHPQVQHLSGGALQGVLKTFQGYASQAAEIRGFIADTLLAEASSSSRKTKKVNRTQQAFADACRGVIEDFDSWLSSLEASFTLGSAGVSSGSIPSVPASSTPSLLSREVERRFAPLLEQLSALIPHSHSPTLLLNLIHSTIISLSQSGATALLPNLYNIFFLSAEPTWKLLGHWLQQGMPIPLSLTDPEEAALSSLSLDDGERELDSELFIERDRDVSWADEDFWECGFIVGDEGWPMWIGDEVGEMVLEAGKAQGLLRSLMGAEGMGTLGKWVSLPNVLSAEGAAPGTVNILEQVGGYLRPMCQISQFHLRRVLDEECGLGQHLDAIEGMMYLRGFDVIDQWTHPLFKKIHSGERWTDFQILTSTLRNVIEDRAAGWMNPSALRIRTVRSQGVYTGPRALEAIRADYQVPFPLSQLLTPTSISFRSEVFTFLMQLHMGRHLLAQTKHCDKELLARVSGSEDDSGVKGMWRVRGRVLWLLDTLYSWLTERVIEDQTAEYRVKLEEMTSLRSMISMELEHTRNLRDYCFLNPSTSDIQDAVLSVLDMTSTLSDCFASYLSQTASSPINTATRFVTRRRPRRKIRRRRQDVSSDEDGDGGEGGRQGRAAEASVSFVELSLAERMRKMDHELELCAAVLKEDVDRLGMDRGGEVWGMLGFALEEWK
ncbi:hypothetical protein IAT38_005719 [Cryptococcus sp. DSM 104549]